MWIEEQITQTRQRRHALQGRIALVPTMGALHAGHMSLIEAAHQMADHVLVSIFVNPKQFGPNEDLDRYPRPREDDLAKCRQAGVAGVFAPQVEAMYQPGEIACTVDVPALTDHLEGARRPGHFAGVCVVVAKLFNILQPDVACFGQKDYQQLKVIEAMTQALSMSIQIAPLPTIREADGLAMSSRNAYLSAEDRRHALGLSKALAAAKELIEVEGETDPQAVESTMQQVMASNQVATDYAVIRHPHSLAPLDCIEPKVTGGVVALVAGGVGGVRLIDNALLGG